MLAGRADVKADTLMVEARRRYVSDVVLDNARTWRADAIVMGTHGRHGLNRLPCRNPRAVCTGSVIRPDVHAAPDVAAAVPRPSAQ
jgi:hypothetical protein